ncbi:MAG: glycosyltransferase [Desulfobacterota bacterium]|nr:glycosyltransferase [Thermodesulfobacteriota bacterium]
MKQHVVHITKVTGIYGMERHLLTLLPALQQRYQVSCIIFMESKKPVSEYSDMLRFRGIAVYPVAADYDIDPRTFFRTASLLRTIKPALVHTHLIHGDLYGIAAAVATGCPCIVSTRHNDDRFRRNIVIRIINRLLASRVQSLIAISDWVAEFAGTVESIPLDKIVTIHYGIDAPQPVQPVGSFRAKLGLSDEHVVCGITARLVAQKGHRDLIRAFAMAHAQCPVLRLIIAGDGPMRQELENEVCCEHLQDSVFFTGYRRDVGDVLASLDVFVHPSRWEGFGLSILEAMACGLPVIATRVSAIPELVGDAGILVPPGDPTALCSALLRLVHSPDLRRELGAKAQHRYETLFTADTMVQKTAALYHALLASARRHKPFA